MKQVEPMLDIRNRIYKKFSSCEYQNQSIQPLIVQKSDKEGYIKHLVLRKIPGHYSYSHIGDDNDDDYLGLFPGSTEKIARVVVKNYNNKVELICGLVSVNLSKDGYIPFNHKCNQMEYKDGFELMSYVSNIRLQIKGNFEKNKKYTIERYVYGYCIEKGNEITSKITNL